MTSISDKLGRKIDYLRISITDRCNLRCQYCMPLEGVRFKPHNQIISYEEIIKIVKVGVKLGIKKVRITGGEPLVRKGVVSLVRRLGNIKELTDISLTTNGLLLPRYIRELKDAGLNRVNISIDSLRKERYENITCRNHLQGVLDGIKSALDMGLDPVKLNVVLMKGINSDEIIDFVNLSRDYPLHVRFIEFMPLGRSKQVQDERYLSIDEIKKKIKKEMDMQPTMVKSNGPADYFELIDSQGTVGFISPISHSFCLSCNRLRLTADGRLRPCLASNIEIDMHDSNGEIKVLDDIREKFVQAINLKPDRHYFNQEFKEFSQRNMFQIGG